MGLDYHYHPLAELLLISSPKSEISMSVRIRPELYLPRGRSRGGEMGEFHPPFPSLLLSFFLISQIFK